MSVERPILFPTLGTAEQHDKKRQSQGRTEAMNFRGGWEAVNI